MHNFKAYKAYQSTQAQTNNPLRVNIMAYEWCLNNLKFVQLKYSEMRFSEADDRLLNTEQILRELRMGLTNEYNVIPENLREQVLEHAAHVRALYDWMIDELNLIRMTKQNDNLQAIIERIQDLLDADRFAEKEYLAQQKPPGFNGYVDGK